MNLVYLLSAPFGSFRSFRTLSAHYSLLLRFSASPLLLFTIWPHLLFGYPMGPRLDPTHGRVSMGTHKNLRTHSQPTRNTRRGGASLDVVSRKHVFTPVSHFIQHTYLLILCFATILSIAESIKALIDSAIGQEQEQRGTGTSGYMGAEGAFVPNFLKKMKTEFASQFWSAFPLGG